MRSVITGANRPAFEVLNGGEVVAGHGVRRPAIEAANELFNDLNDNSSNYYKTRVLKTKQINSRSSINHFAFHLANPINVFFRNIFLKHLSKNKNFLENYLGKIYKS